MARNTNESRFPRQLLPALPYLMHPCSRAPTQRHSGFLAWPAGRAFARPWVAFSSNTFLLALMVAFLLAACAGSPPAAPPERRQTLPSPGQTPAPAAQQTPGVQVFPLQNPAIKSLLEDAREAEARGDYDQAAISLERALRIQPRDPELLQSMAEIQLGKKDYEQALNFAIRSYDAGARVGDICSRNWNTISVARLHTGDASGAAEATQRATECSSAKPPGY